MKESKGLKQKALKEKRLKTDGKLPVKVNTFKPTLKLIF